MSPSLHPYLGLGREMGAATVQQLCKSCRACFKFYCMFYFTCDRSLRQLENALIDRKPPPVARNANTILFSPDIFANIFRRRVYGRRAVCTPVPDMCSRTCCPSACRTATTLIAPRSHAVHKFTSLRRHERTNQPTNTTDHNNSRRRYK